MEHETFYATSAQVLPAIAIAAGLELRFLVKRLESLGVLAPPRNVMYWFAHLYTRLLGLAAFAAVLLTVNCIWTLKTESPSPHLDSGLYFALGFAPVAMALPFLGAVFNPRDLLRWYGGADE